MPSTEHIRDLKAHLAHRNPEVAEFFSLINISDDVIAQLETAVQHTDGGEFFAAVSEAMTQFKDDFVAQASNRLSPQQQSNLVDRALTFTGLVTELSPEFKRQMQDKGLEHATAHELFADQQKLQNLHKLFLEMSEFNNLKQVQLDFMQTLQQAVHEAVEATAAQVERLKASRHGDKHKKGGESEAEYVIEASIDAASSGAFFDKLRRLAHLLAFLWHHQFVVPFEKEYYPRAFKFNKPTQNAFKNFQQDKFANSNVIDPGLGQAAAAGPANIPASGPPLHLR